MYQGSWASVSMYALTVFVALRGSDECQISTLSLTADLVVE